MIALAVLSWSILVTPVLAIPPCPVTTMAEHASTVAYRDLVWRCNPGPQRELLFGELGRVREIMWGGGKGGGKSAAIGPKALLHVDEHPVHARVLILREDSGQLTDLMDKMEPLCIAAGGKFNASKLTWKFPDGARIRFGHLVKGVAPYWGQEYTLIIIDELTRCMKTLAEYKKLRSSLRNPHGIQGQIIGLTNPGGAGHVWVKAYFKQAPPNTIHRDAKGRERVFIPALLSDNPHLPVEYRDELNEMGEAERKAYAEGDWDAFEGSVFRLVKGVHVLTWADFKEKFGSERPPADWKRFRSYDHGFAAPGASYWYSVNHAGQAIVYRELYTVAYDKDRLPIPNKGSSTPPRDVAKMIALRSEGERYDASWTGRDLFDEVRGDHGGGLTLATHFAAEKIFFTAWTTGPNSRIAGKQALHQRLAYEVGADGNLVREPGIIFIEEECPHVLRTLPTLEYSKTQPEQVDDQGEDHAFDSIAGFCKMNPWAPPTKEKPNTGWRERVAAPRTSDWMTS